MFQPIISGLFRSPLRTPRKRFMAVFAACLATGLSLSPAVRGAGLDAPAADAAVPATTAGAPSAEYLLKAAFLFKFAKFTSWPSAAFDGDAAPILLCVLGDNPFGIALPALDGRLVQGRPLATREISDSAGVAGCHLLFIGRSVEAAVATSLDAPGGQPLLIVGDRPGFARRGAMINLKIVDDRIRFEINIASARLAGLRLDTRLLQLADGVYTSQNSTDRE